MTLASCAGVPIEHGRTGVPAAYEFDGVLRARMTGRASPGAVRAAARDALASRGYAIIEDYANEGFSRVCGGESRVGAWDRVWARTVTVEARPAGSETAVSVRVQPLGDEAESRAVFVETLTRLGV